MILTHNLVVRKTDYIPRGKTNDRTITVTTIPKILIGNRALQDEIINNLFPATDDICYSLLHNFKEVIRNRKSKNR